MGKFTLCILLSHLVINGIQPLVTLCIRHLVINGMQPLVTPLIEPLDILGFQPPVTPLIEQLDILGFQPPVTPLIELLVTPLVEQQPLFCNLLLKGHILLLKDHILLLNGQSIQLLLKVAQMIGSMEATLDVTSSLMIFLSTGLTQRVHVKGKADT